MQCKSMMVGYTGGPGVEILTFIKIRRLQRLVRLDIDSAFPDAEAASSGPVPGFQDGTSISQLAQFISRGHARQPGSQDDHLLSLSIPLQLEGVGRCGREETHGHHGRISSASQ